MPKWLDYKQESDLKKKIHSKYADKFSFFDFELCGSFLCLKNQDTQEYQEAADMIKYLFKQGEDEKSFLWNSIYDSADDGLELNDLRESDFTDEEFEFIKSVFLTRCSRQPRDCANVNDEIKTERLILKPYDETLNKTYREYFLSRPEEFETYYQVEFDNGIINNINYTNSLLHFAIIEADGDKYIGSIGLNVLSNDNKLDIEYCIFDEYRGNGFAYETVAAIIDAVRNGKIVVEYETIRKGIFEVKPIRPLYLQFKINVNNAPSIAIAEKVGAIKDGILRAERIMRNEPLDYYVYTVKI
jgi:RimJ/RimL family protein N-acetyltransferase